MTYRNYKGETCTRTAMGVIAALNGYLNKNVTIERDGEGWHAWGIDKHGVKRRILNTYSDVSNEDCAGKVVKHYLTDDAAYVNEKPISGIDAEREFELKCEDREEALAYKNQQRYED